MGNASLRRFLMHFTVSTNHYIILAVRKKKQKRKNTVTCKKSSFLTVKIL